MPRTDLASPAIPGGSVTGPPTSGTHKQFEIWPDSAGTLWVCTVAGTPGTWISQGSSSSSVPLLGSRLEAYGHSFLTAGGATHPDRQYITILAGLLRSGLTDVAVGGSQAADDELVQTVGGHGGWAWVLQNRVPYHLSAPYGPNGATPLLNYGINDISQHKADASGTPHMIFKEAMRTIMSRCVASRVFEDGDASIALSGVTWPVAVSPLILFGNNANSGTTYQPLPAGAGIFTITLPTDFEGGSIAVGFTVYPGSSGTITWTGTATAVSSGGDQFGLTTSLALKSYAANGNTGTGTRNSTNGIVVRFTGLTSADASKTIIGTLSSMGSAVATASAPGAITHGGTAGSTTYTYEWVAGNANGDGIHSTTTSTATGNATLTAGNTNIIPTPGAFPTGATYMKLVRTVGGTTQGAIAYLTAPAAVTDTGINAQTYTASTINPLQGGAALDYWQIESTTPVIRGVLVNITYPTAAKETAQGIANADVDAYNADLVALAAEFASNQWLYVDTNPVIGGNVTLLASDGLHPNDRGHALLASTLGAAIIPWAGNFASSDVAFQSRLARSVSSRSFVRRYYSLSPGNLAASFTGADYVLSSGSWAAVDATNIVVFIDASVGDDLEASLEACMTVSSAGTASVLIDAATVDTGGAVISYFNAPFPDIAASTPSQVGGPFTPKPMAMAASSIDWVGGKTIWTVTPADIQTFNTVPGIVCVQLRYDKSAGTGVPTLFAGGTSTSPPLKFGVANLGKRNSGFNAS